MHQGNWTCSGCGGEITELPFEPRSTNNLLCKKCFAKNAGGGESKAENQEGAPANGNGERKMFEGDWKCSECGGSITKLPFQPRSESNLRCVDCFKKGRQ